MNLPACMKGWEVMGRKAKWMESREVLEVTSDLREDSKKMFRARA